MSAMYVYYVATVTRKPRHIKGETVETVATLEGCATKRVKATKLSAHPPSINALVAQLAERRLGMAEVESSILFEGPTFACANRRRLTPPCVFSSGDRAGSF